MHRVAGKVQDKRVLRLIGKYLRAGVKAKGRYRKTHQGVPQGGPLSPLLANILLHDLDRELEKGGHRFVRYADDFIILVKSVRAGERVKRSIRHFLERRLKLQINERKAGLHQSITSISLALSLREPKSAGLRMPSANSSEESDN